MVVQEGCNVLQQDNIHNLSEQKPGIVFEGQVLVLLRNSASGGRDEKPHVERVVLPHFSNELFLDPFSHQRPLFLVEPSAALDFANDPFPLALLGQGPSQPSVIGSPPEDEITKEEKL